MDEYGKIGEDTHTLDEETWHERKKMQHEGNPPIKMFFSRPDNTKLLLTQAPGQWHSTLYSCPDYISPVAVNI